MYSKSEQNYLGSINTHQILLSPWDPIWKVCVSPGGAHYTSALYLALRSWYGCLLQIPLSLTDTNTYVEVTPGRYTLSFGCDKSQHIRNLTFCFELEPWPSCPCSDISRVMESSQPSDIGFTYIKYYVHSALPYCSVNKRIIKFCHWEGRITWSTTSNVDRIACTIHETSMNYHHSTLNSYPSRAFFCALWYHWTNNFWEHSTLLAWQHILSSNSKVQHKRFSHLFDT